MTFGFHNILYWILLYCIFGFHKVVYWGFIKLYIGFHKIYIGIHNIVNYIQMLFVCFVWNNKTLITSRN